MYLISLRGQPTRCDPPACGLGEWLTIVNFNTSNGYCVQDIEVYTHTYTTTHARTYTRTHTHHVLFNPFPSMDNQSHVPYCYVRSTLDVCFGIYPCVYSCCIACVLLWHLDSTWRL
jgi:hypothetical protein